MPTPYRTGGADLPFGRPEDAHGVAMEGYFWRFTDAASGRVVIALIGVQRGAATDGSDDWALAGLGGSDGFWRHAVLPHGVARARGLGARGWSEGANLGAGPTGGFFHGTDEQVVVDLGPDARLAVRLRPAHRWPGGVRRPFGGSSWFQSVPALNQYWHPWLLAGRASGEAVVGGETWRLDDVPAYGEKNWGRGGFPESWWWGQAHGFAEPDACVAFAGGQVHSGPLRTEVTALVVRLPDGEVVRLGNPGTSPVAAEVSDERWRLRGRSLTPRGWTIDVDGSAPLGDAHVLPVPLVRERVAVPGALEHLAGTLSVTVRRGGREVWSGESRLAGLEHGGLARAQAEAARRTPGSGDGPRLG